MSAKLPVLLAVFGAVATLSAQRVDVNGAGEKEIVVTERGPHHRVWQRESVRVLPNGRAITNRSAMVELETGLHHQKDGQWVESREEIELFQRGAIARNGPHQVIFEPNSNTRGAIDLLTADGKRLRSHVIGLGLFDPSTGNSELIAEVKDSIGELQPPNEIFYRDAFDGLKADLRYTYRKGSFVQDVIVREKVVLPETFNPATTRLEVWTEFIEAPTPEKVVRSRGGASDELLDFGAMQIGPGKAFSLDETDSKSAPVIKRWMQIEGRTFLVEAVQFAAVREQVERLPDRKEQAAVIRKPAMLQADASKRPFPAMKKAAVRKPDDKIQMANLVPPSRGLVLDYDLTGTLTNYLFKCDTTYYISGTVTLRNPTFEGGTVIKYANTNSAQLKIPDPSAGVTFSASAYRPVILTARDDHSVGEKIGTASLSGFYAKYGLWFGSGATPTLEHLRVSRAVVGLAFDESAPTLRHSQIVACGDAIETHWCNPVLENVLVYSVTNAFSGEMSASYKVTARHLTVNLATNLSSYDNVDARLTNSLLMNVGNIELTLLTNAVITAASTTAFETVGAAAHYLNTNSSHRNVGTTNIGMTLLGEIRKRTTYPPVVIGNGGYFTNSLTLYTQAQRDTDTPDLGYHYDPLDYVFSSVILTNASITAMPGVAIGVRNLNNVGLGLLGGSAFYSEGTPDNLNRFVRYNTVQEQANTNWMEYASDYAYALGLSWSTTPTAPILRLRFAEFSVPAAPMETKSHIYGFSGDTGTHSIRDCQFHGGDVWSLQPGLNITNSLFNRTRAIIAQSDGSMSVTLKNCTFVGGDLQLYNDETGSWVIKDTLFDDTTTYTEGAFTHNYNAYTTNAVRLTPNGANDIQLSVTNIAYQSGWLGKFYIPTNLTSHSTIFNVGSQYATNAGLYHYTMVTNQTRELSTMVDIGFHYVAVNSSGRPIDTDGDGLGDYFEDADGDGAAEVGESSYTDWDTDYDGRNDGQEYTDGTSLIDASSVTQVLLGRWRFNTNTWPGDQGQLPKSHSNLVSAASWSTNAVLVNSNTVANLKYRDVETNALANINCRSGTIRFWFKPIWASTNQGGTGPGNYGHLLALGSYTNNASYGYWSLAIDARGTNLHLITQDAGVGTTNLTASIGWVSNEWHQVVVTYSSSNSTLYLNGQPAVTNGLGIQKYPAATVRAADGFSIGSNRLGTEQAKGSFEELETYNYVLSAATIQSDYQQVMNGDNDGDGIIDGFDGNPSSFSVGPAISIDRPRNGQTVR